MCNVSLLYNVSLLQYISFALPSWFLTCRIELGLSLIFFYPGATGSLREYGGILSFVAALVVSTALYKSELIDFKYGCTAVFVSVSVDDSSLMS